MARPIKHICKQCDHIERESWLEHVTKKMLFLLITILSAVGAMALIFISMAGMNYTLNLMTELPLTHYAKNNHEEIRTTALQLTTYSGDDSYEMARDLARNIPPTRYVLPGYFKTIYAPSYTLENGGDCKNSAIMFTSMMLSLGYEARVDCNSDKAHCVTFIEEKNPLPELTGTYMIVDLTADTIKIYRDDTDFWKEPHKNIGLIEVIQHAS